MSIRQLMSQQSKPWLDTRVDDMILNNLTVDGNVIFNSLATTEIVTSEQRTVSMDIYQDPVTVATVDVKFSIKHLNDGTGVREVTMVVPLANSLEFTGTASNLAYLKPGATAIPRPIESCNTVFRISVGGIGNELMICSNSQFGGDIVLAKFDGTNIGSNSSLIPSFSMTYLSTGDL